jgi:hypothetical protein
LVTRIGLAVYLGRRELSNLPTVRDAGTAMRLEMNVQSGLQPCTISTHASLGGCGQTPGVRLAVILVAMSPLLSDPQ